MAFVRILLRCVIATWDSLLSLAQFHPRFARMSSSLSPAVATLSLQLPLRVRSSVDTTISWLA